MPRCIHPFFDVMVTCDVMYCLSACLNPYLGVMVTLHNEVFLWLISLANISLYITTSLYINLIQKYTLLISARNELNNIYILGTLITCFTNYLMKSSKIIDKYYFMLFMSNTNQLCRDLFAKRKRSKKVKKIRCCHRG